MCVENPDDLEEFLRWHRRHCRRMVVGVLAAIIIGGLLLWRLL